MDYRLVAARPAHIEELYSWFGNQQQLSEWAGPGLTWPLDLDTFSDLIRWQALYSFALESEQGNTLGFGQFYPRLQRHHLGRLAIHPGHRGQGLGRVLVNTLIDKAHSIQPQAGISLFVMASNTAALKCYKGLGFVSRPYPCELPDQLDDCFYMILPKYEPKATTLAN